ncbi:serine protease [Singulisphaera sp. Ch08]|uniref:Serine protease n=1 Tax=Singulisphaera sp. Ch08 TaxID=3120278 RepID=A0AAU7CBD0_9BACT
MFRLSFIIPVLLCILTGTIPAQAQVSPDVIERGKRATALVEVFTDKGQATGSAFCIDKSGLFVTNAHVISGGGTGERINLVLDIGRKSQRTLPAEPLWIDEEIDLALLKARPRSGSLTELTLGMDSDLKEGDEVTTFGFPFGKQLAVDTQDYTEVSVNLSRITSLRKEANRLGTIKFDGQLNPGNSGGPVLGPRGQVVGVAVATVVGGGVNYAIPVGQLSARLERPGLQALIPPMDYHDRVRPVTWTFNALMPWSSGKLPEGLSVILRLSPNVGEPRTIVCEPLGNDRYHATFTPVPRDRTRLVRLEIFPPGNHSGIGVAAEVKDCDVTVGKRRFMLGDLRSIAFHPGYNQGPYVILGNGEKVDGIIKGLGSATEARDIELWLVPWGTGIPPRENVVAVGVDNAGLVHIRAYDKGRLFADTDEKKKTGAHAAAFADLKQKLPELMPPHALTPAERKQILANVFSIIGRPRAQKFNLTLCSKVNIGAQVDWAPPVRTIHAVAELRSGGTTLATAHRVLDFSIVPSITVVTVRGESLVIRDPRFNPRSSNTRIFDDEEMLTTEGTINVDGTPCGAGRSIRPAVLPDAAPGSAVVRTLEGQVSDLAVGGGGRYLLLVLKAVRKLAIFDINAAKVVKTIPLPSENVMVAAGARKFVVAFPEERLLQRWDLETLTSEGGFHPSPIKEELKAIAMGSDSDGPILAHWSPVKPSDGPTQLSFIDLDSLHVLRLGPISGRALEVSSSRGSFTGLRDIRVSPGGSLFSFWNGNSSSQVIRTVSVRGRMFNHYIGDYLGDLISCGFASPGADDRTIFTGALGRLDGLGKPIGDALDPPWAKAREDQPWEVLTVPSADPAYYLVLEQAPYRRNNYKPTGPVVASVHSAGDATRLLTIPTLQEMTGFKVEDWYSGRIGVDQRFHYVPAARLLITIPPTNDRLVLRRVDIEPAIDRVGAIIVLSPPLVNAVAGQPLDTRIVAKSPAGDVKFTLTEGPKGLSVSSDGRISWPQPDQPGDPAEIVLSLSDLAGRKRIHKVVIRVQ